MVLIMTPIIYEFSKKSSVPGVLGWAIVDLFNVLRVSMEDVLYQIHYLCSISYSMSHIHVCAMSHLVHQNENQ